MASRTIPDSPPLFYRLHLGLTALLLVSLVAFVSLAAVGRVHFGRSATSPEGGKSADGKSKETSSTEGRYQIEPIDDARRVMGVTGRTGFLGPRIPEVWVFRYRGGFLECTLESDFGGRLYSSTKVPDDWSRILATDEGIKLAD